jgi:transposase
VFVRPLSVEEGRKLQRITRRSKDPVRLRRAIVVLMSGQGRSVPDITALLQVSADYVRDVIHAFNERGFAALDPKPSGGRPRRIGEQLREWICLIARTSPADRGITAFATWSLAKLREHLLAQGIVAELGRETLRRILRAGGVSWQSTTTWKASSDPDFIAKMRRVLDLYDRPPADGRVVCVDEFGPLNLRPRKGKAWRPVRRPRRLRATYTRSGGVRHMLAALDLATGRGVLSDPGTQALDRVLGSAQGAAGPLAAREALRGLRQLLPAPPRPRPRLVPGQPGRVGVPADLRVVAELDRGRVRRAALLRPRRHRPPQPRRTERRDRRLRPLAQPPSPTEGQLRHRLTDPDVDRLPGQGCVTSH